MNWYDTIKLAQENICAQQIVFTPIEQKIFSLLLSVKQSSPAMRNTSMLVAGGWTRDKLLGQPSDDIDIALSNMTGADFVQSIRSFGTSNHIEGMGKTYLIEDNIEKSKHLATAGIDLFGQKVEFVNLRSEEYGNSRVPTMKMGTPQEDAARRDLTINALFYNIETGQIEDYVGGCQDLQNMVLRTPLDPVKTFQDDPLRMLRVLRFYSRFQNAQIDPAIIDAIKKPEVQAAYKKLSPERASPEILKMMKGAKPVDATRILFETGLYKSVFNIPDNYMDIRSSQRSHHHQYTLMEHTLKVMQNIYDLSQQQKLPDDERALLCLSSMFHDFGKMSPNIRQPHPKQPGYFRYVGHEDVSTEMANEIMTRMSFTPEAKKFVTTIVSSHMKAHNEGLFEDNPQAKKKLGKFLRKVDKFYDKILMHGLADDLAKGDLTDEERQEVFRSRQSQIDHVNRYKQEQGQLINKPLLDGNQIREILLTEVPDMVEDNAFINVKEYKKPMHFIAYTMEELLKQQWMGRIRTVQEAEYFVRKNAKQWFNLWQKNTPEQS